MYDPTDKDFEEIDAAFVEAMNADTDEEQYKIATSKTLKAKQQSQMSDMRDCGYYAVVVFANTADKNTFLQAIEKSVNVEDGRFIDGYQLAQQMGVNVRMTASLPKPHYINKLKIKKNGK
jgi:hypothetical protein